MIRAFAGLTDEDRQNFRDGVLGVTADAIQETAARYFIPAAESAVIAVYASEDRLLQANEILSPKLVVENLI
jgi:Zn-dependent M16 (insulinase) family peptidase